MGDSDEIFERFDSIIARHGALIERLCRRYAAYDKELCDDYRQDCYCSLWHYFPTLREGATPIQERSWVIWHCRSVFSHRKYRHRKHQYIPLTREITDTVAESDDNDARDTIEALATMLTPHERDALLLIADGYCAEDLAKEFGIKHRSAVLLRHRIINKLKDKLNID